MSETETKLKYLVADTTAFINAVPLNEYAENVLTVPEVIAEVRNKRQLRRLCVLPFDLQVREPRIESVKYCVDFAKKTGDYASLSGIDIKVISLTYELEVENVGIEHLRKEPVVSQIIASKDKPEVFHDNTKLVGWYNPDGSEDSQDDNESNSENEDTCNKEQSGEIDLIKESIEKQISIENSTNSIFLDTDTGEASNEIYEKELSDLLEKLKCEPEKEREKEANLNILVPQQEQKLSDKKDADVKSNSSCEDDSECEGQDNDNSWITPSNIKKLTKSVQCKDEDYIIPLVACVSTDYAIQNVLKQMNLHISGLNGRVIKHLRTYILRCYACFKTTSVITKVFCPNCGNKTLKRVAVSLDENGKQVIHINTRRPLTAKYKNQSIPRFRGGKHSHNPILFEDQPLPRQMPSRVAKTKTNALEEDYIAGFSPFVMRDVDSKSAILRSAGHVKEWARNNRYEEDMRKKRYNRVYK